METQRLPVASPIQPSADIVADIVPIGRVAAIEEAVFYQLHRVEDALRGFRLCPCKACQSRIEDALVDLRDARRSRALARWWDVPR
jgi:hypothetical protein